METILSLLRAGDTVLGIMGSVFVALMGFLAWFDRRGRRYADDVRSASDVQHDRTQNRLTHVEGRLVEIEGDVHDMSNRITVLEHKLNTLATAKDVGDLAVRLAGLIAHSEQMSGKVDTLYRAALTRSTEGR